MSEQSETKRAVDEPISDKVERLGQKVKEATEKSRPVKIMDEETKTYFDRLKNDHCFMQIWFERDPDTPRIDPAYKEVMFNHLGIHLPYQGIIWEHVGGILGFPQCSSDKYLPKNRVRIILPLDLRDKATLKRVSDAIKDSKGQYGDSSIFVNLVLEKLEIIKSRFRYADDLYRYLWRRYGIPVETIVRFYRPEQFNDILKDPDEDALEKSKL